MEIAYDYGISAGMSGVSRNKRKDLIRGGKARELVVDAYSWVTWIPCMSSSVVSEKEGQTKNPLLRLHFDKRNELKG